MKPSPRPSMLSLLSPFDIVICLGVEAYEASKALKGLLARINPTIDHISANIAANLYAVEQMLYALPQDVQAGFQADFTQIMSAFESSQDNKQKMKLLLRRAVNLRETVADICQKQRMVQLKNLAYAPKNEETQQENIIPLRDSPLLACIGNGSTRPIAALQEDPSMPIGPEGLKIGPLPEDWFDVPSDIDAKFQSLLDWMRAGYAKGKDAHAIAYDMDARYIYVEFPAPIYAMYFVDNWSTTRPEGLGKVKATFFAIQ
ncbi:hypothetical protein EV368DRAFT_83939 [Lentinula lateritia]|nr:hypothetical protein EV368DRAFT_83939 [Lentinula lateritia]